ncbi:unnamed protein product [Rotaria sp. Silwood2]|nr:unnamed protein product [Rotaria sp. Silwood2]CAF4439764.1 unnamed protein product [Rotaria sp. Silwood2]
MNALEEEYSFLAPTWKLPAVATSSLYPGTYETFYSPSGSGVGSETVNRNNTTYNPRYVPPPTNHRNHPQIKNQQPQRRSIPAGPPPPPPPLPLAPQTYQNSKDQYQSNENSNVDLDSTIIHNPHYEHNMPMQPRNNGYSNQQIDNRGSNYPPPPQPIQKRVQIIDHNRQTPSTDYMSGRESRNSSPYNDHSPESNQNQQKFKPRRNQTDDNKSDSINLNGQRSNNFNVHEYLYGLSAPDPGSYVSAFKDHRRRLQDEKVNQKSIMTQYKTFVQNGGFGPAFGNADHLAYEEKLQTERKRKTYSKLVRAANQYKVEEQKRIQNNGGQQRNRAYVASMPRHRPLDATRSHFLSAEEVREFERRIKREHDANCIACRYSILSPILIASLPVCQHVSNRPLLCQSIFNKLHPWNQNDILSGEFYVDRTNRSSLISSCSRLPKISRIYSYNHDLIQPESSLFIDLPTEIIRKNIFHRNKSKSNDFHIEKLIKKIHEEKNQLELNDIKYFQNLTNHYSCSVSNIIEKKFITSHSMMNNNNIQSPPPTVKLKIINQPYRSNNTTMSTASANTITRKPILIIKSPDSSTSKSITRNVHFLPDIIVNDNQIRIPIQDSLTIQSTKHQIRKLSSPSTMTKSTRKIKTNQQHKESISTPRNNYNSTDD